MNIITEVIFTHTSQKAQSTKHKAQTTNENQLKLYFSPLLGTTLPRFTSVLTHNSSTISGATNHTHSKAANESQLHEASMDLDNLC